MSLKDIGKRAAMLEMGIDRIMFSVDWPFVENEPGTRWLNALPYTYFLDADGAIAYTQVGPVHSLDELRALVAEHLGVRL